MSESDSFISEVSEEVRRERFYRFLRRYGWLFAVGLLLIVGGAGANEWRKARADAAAQAAGDALRAAYLQPDPAQRAAELARLAEEGGGSEALARIAQAGSLTAAGEREAAAAALAETAEDGAAPAVWRALASLQRVMILGDAMDRAEREATLATLAAEGAAFRPLALEQRALMRLEAGETEAALADLEAALGAPAAPEGLLARARQLIIAAGGALPAEPGPGAGAVPADG